MNSKFKTTKEHDMLTREELLLENWIFPTLVKAQNFALKWCNYYDGLHNEIGHILKDEFYVVFTEQDNE